MKTVGRDEVVKEAFRHRDALISHAFALLRDWSQAEDAVQDAFIVVMNKWADFRPGTSVFLWVRQIVHYKVQEALRSRGKTSPLEQELLAQVAGVMAKYLDEHESERQTLMHRALQRCMSFLNPRAVDLLAGFYAQSESCEEIAQAQGRTINAIRLSLSRLRKQLHECMSRQLPTLEARR